ncbi:hypothetical protein [Gordonia zhaorongruii]|uniref:hypothetical protein n=1 Tax=Gordonia zhaorongruii TaxID=2597659 RepID=UPI00140519E3|nr:hypothetical protein [Gordonia zhaorongruii]
MADESPRQTDVVHVLEVPRVDPAKLWRCGDIASSPQAGIPGWAAFESAVDRFQPVADLRSSQAFSAAVAEWGFADTSVVCAFIDETVSIHGLSYQSSRCDLASAVWAGFCRGIAAELTTRGADGEVVLRSDHPGSDSLARELASLGVAIRGESSAGDPGDLLEMDRLVRAASASDAECMRRSAS